MKKRFMIRQGDVLVVQITDEIPKAAKVIEKDNLTLALGEQTGHSHAILSPGAVMYAVNENLKIMELQEAAELVHQEHAPIQLPAGRFQIIQQREYIAGRIVNVAD